MVHSDNTLFARPSIDFQAALNDDQYAAVTAPRGAALVLAGAGSGKTRTLTYRVAYLLQQGVNPSEILLLTFTNKAAKEMLLRVEDLSGIPHYKFWGGTFHHIANKTLRFHGQSIGIQPNFTILDEGDSNALLGDVILAQDSGFLKNKDNPKPKLIADIISYARNTQNSLKSVLKDRYPYLEHLAGSLENFFQAWQQQKLKNQSLNYDDLLVYWLKLLQEDPESAKYYQGRFRFILVDEYQDTNRLQAAIIDTLGVHHQIMAVGDDSQCIYTWRGADFDNILSFPKRHPGAQIYKIETNYRSSPEILNLANFAINHRDSTLHYPKALRAIKPSRVKPYFVSAIDSYQQARFICQRIHGLLSEGRSLRDIAILYRAHFHAMDLQMELSRQNFPYQITSGVRFFEQAHIRDLVAQLRFLYNPSDAVAFTRFIGLLPKIGPKTADRLLELTDKTAQKNSISFFQALDHDAVKAKVPEIAREAWIDVVYTLQDAHEAIRVEKPEVIVKIIIEGWYSDFLRNIYENWTSRQDDLESLITFASRFEDLSELLAQLTLLASESSHRSADVREDSIRLSTVHQAKGLEWPVVFIIGLAEGLFPLQRAIDEDNIDEERRLFYVATTRAEEELYLVYPRLTAQGGFPSMQSASSFIQDLPKDCYEVLKVNQRF